MRHNDHQGVDLALLFYSCFLLIAFIEIRTQSSPTRTSRARTRAEACSRNAHKSRWQARSRHTSRCMSDREMLLPDHLGLSFGRQLDFKTPSPLKIQLVTICRCPKGSVEINVRGYLDFSFFFCLPSSLHTLNIFRHNLEYTTLSPDHRNWDKSLDVRLQPNFPPTTLLKNTSGPGILVEYKKLFPAIIYNYL